MEFANFYDVVIAGAGAAGCVLASRLSERPDKTVLLIEAGPDAPPGEEHADIRDPFPISSDNPAFHWPGQMAEVGTSLNNEVPEHAQPYIKGFGVGGGSNVNGMAADRGQPGDYDTWGGLWGASGWSWNTVLPYFIKLEHDLDFSGSNVPLVHGNSGPMPVRRLPRSRWAPFTAAFGEALETRGFPFIADYMSDFRDGFAAVPTNSLLEGRVSASMAYLTAQVRRRPNLTILTNARADRLEINQSRVTGVHVHTLNETRLILGREVIVSCGALRSPVLLMRSGIGPSAELARHGVRVVRDMPGVGSNLQNHPIVLLTTYLTNASWQSADNPWFLQNWVRFSSRFSGCADHDMHLMQFNKTAWHTLGKRVGLVGVSVLDAHSKGRVSLQSIDPAAPPKVVFNLLSDERDFERLVAGTRFALELLTESKVAETHDGLFRHNPRIVADLAARNGWNGFKAWTIASLLDRAPIRRLLLAGVRVNAAELLREESRLRSFVRQYAGAQAHDCGTCRMGLANDQGAVVDGAGCVHGIQSLRVVDASIFPAVPRGYPHFVVLMTAEKIADAVKAEWSRYPDNVVGGK